MDPLLYFTSLCNVEPVDEATPDQLYLTPKSDVVMMYRGECVISLITTKAGRTWDISTEHGIEHVNEYHVRVSSLNRIKIFKQIEIPAKFK